MWDDNFPQIMHTQRISSMNHENIISYLCCRCCCIRCAVALCFEVRTLLKIHLLCNIRKLKQNTLSCDAYGMTHFNFLFPSKRKNVSASIKYTHLYLYLYISMHYWINIFVSFSHPFHFSFFSSSSFFCRYVYLLSLALKLNKWKRVSIWKCSCTKEKKWVNKRKECKKKYKGKEVIYMYSGRSKR